MSKAELAPVPKRLLYPKTLKARIVARCSRPGTSIAGVALSHGVNANLVHKWIRQAERQHPVAPAFVPVALPAVPSAGQHIRIRLSGGPAQATVQWPVSETGACVAVTRAAAIMSLIQSARLNGHDPYAYLNA